MKVNISFIFLIIFSMSSQFGCTSSQSPKDAKIEQDALVVFLVRHAEKADLSKDPELSEAGKERAFELAKILRSANIEYVHSSDFIRTRETAAPTADEFGLTVEIYDQGDLEELARKVRAQGGRHLIVGHSNTTPKMVELLGGDPGSEINEAGEFDRLYVVNGCANNTGSSIMMRYGSPYNESSGN